MNTEGDKNFKIRFRFPNGEEFEAEGNREFIEQQRNYFLALIGKRQAPAVISLEPAVQRAPAPRMSIPTPPLPRKDFTLSPIERPRETPAAPQENTPFPALRLWERLLKEDGDIVVLRKKMRLNAVLE